MTDPEREALVALLARRCAEGYMSLETLEERVERVLAAPTRAGAAHAADDVPRDATFRTRVGRLRLAAALERVPTVEVELPAAGRLVLGRSRSCGVVLDHPSVSRRHLELQPAGEHWEAVDLESLNGTWLDGRRVARARVRRGDALVLGDCPVRFA
jgi:hypothetical protein